MDKQLQPLWLLDDWLKCQTRGHCGKKNHEPPLQLQKRFLIEGTDSNCHWFKWQNIALTPHNNVIFLQLLLASWCVHFLLCDVCWLNNVWLVTWFSPKPAKLNRLHLQVTCWLKCTHTDRYTHTHTQRHTPVIMMVVMLEYKRTNVHVSMDTNLQAPKHSNVHNAHIHLWEFIKRLWCVWLNRVRPCVISM